MRQSKSLGIAVVLGLLLRRRSVQANLTPFHDTPPPSTGLYILGESRPDVNTRGKFGRRGGSVVDKPVPPRNSNFLAYRDLRQVRRKDDCTGSRTFGEIDSALKTALRAGWKSKNQASLLAQSAAQPGLRRHLRAVVRRNATSPEWATQAQFEIRGQQVARRVDLSLSSSETGLAARGTGQYYSTP